MTAAQENIFADKLVTLILEGRLSIDEIDFSIFRGSFVGLVTEKWCDKINAE